MGKLSVNKYSMVLKWCDARPEKTSDGLVFKARWGHKTLTCLEIPLTISKAGKITVQFSYGAREDKAFYPSIPAHTMLEAAEKVLDRIAKTAEKLEESKR